MQLLKLEQESLIHTLTNAISTAPLLVNKTAGILRNQKFITVYKTAHYTLIQCMSSHNNSSRSILILFSRLGLVLGIDYVIPSVFPIETS